MVRIGIIMLLKLGVKAGKVFTVWTDNSTTFGAILKRKSRDSFVNEEWKTIQNILISNNIDIQAKRVTLALNAAERLSRGDKSNHK